MVAAATTAVAGVAVALAFQMAGGRDPALGRAPVMGPATAIARRQIVVRKIERRVIVDVVRDRPALVAPSSSPAPARTRGPVRAAAPNPTPAPAPAPAPVVTRTS
jgi:hypothetical protein